MKLTEHCLLRVDLYLLFLCHLQTSLTAFYFFFFFEKKFHCTQDLKLHFSAPLWQTDLKLNKRF